MCFQPLRSRGRVIWKSRVAPKRARGLVRSISTTDHGRDSAYMWGNVYTAIVLLKSIQIDISLEWVDARLRYYD